MAPVGCSHLSSNQSVKVIEPSGGLGRKSKKKYLFSHEGLPGGAFLQVIQGKLGAGGSLNSSFWVGRRFTEGVMLELGIVG